MDNIQPIQITTKNDSEFPDFQINNEINDDCEIIIKEKQYKTFKAIISIHTIYAYSNKPKNISFNKY